LTIKPTLKKMTKIVELSHFGNLCFIHDGGQRLNNDKFSEPIMLQ